MDLGWVWTDNLRPLAVELARMTGYSFDDSDWIAIELGIGGTDAEDGRWLDDPLGRLSIGAALEPGAGEMVIVAAEGVAEEEQPLIGWLGDMMRNWHLSG